MKKSFTLIEFVFVIVIVGILSAIALAKLTNNNELDLATNQIMQHIRYTQNLALIDDKYTPASSLDLRSVHATNLQKQKATKYWYKQNWQLMFADRTEKTSKRKILSYVVFSDSATNSNSKTGKKEFNGVAGDNEIPKDPSLPQLPMGFLADDKNVQNKKFNLTDTYGIKEVRFWGCGGGNGKTNGKRIMFDFFGKPYIGFNKGAPQATALNPYKALHKVKQDCTIEIKHETQGSAYICLENQTGYIRRVKTKEACKVAK